MASLPLYLFLILITTIPSTYYIYNYPRIHGCSWPNPEAPFRLLALADPQIEGDEKRKSWRGRIDIWGNDRYLRHVHRSTLQQVSPEATHEVVLGDLFSSQWIKEADFLWRVRRYKDVIFKDDEVNEQRLQGQLYGADRFMNITGNHDVGYAGELNTERLERWETHFGPSNIIHILSIPNLPPLRIVLFNTLNLDSPATDSDLQNTTHSFLRSLLPADEEEPIPQTVLLTHLPLYRGPGVCSDPPRFDYWNLNVTDRHGNVTGCYRPIKHQNHLSRWASDWILETIFGEHDEGVILGGHDHNGCDVLHRRLTDSEQEGSWTADVVHDELKRRKRDVDDVEIPAETIAEAMEENFDDEYLFGDDEDDEIYNPWEDWQYEMHERNNLTQGIWKAERYTPNTSGIRELTVRSMMGEFRGNVGLLTGSYNHGTQQVWEFEYATCSFVIQHWWWALHIWDIACILWALGYITRPLWWIHWQRKGQPMLAFALETGSEHVQEKLEKWGLVTRERKRQDTEQSERKRI